MRALLLLLLPFGLQAAGVPAPAEAGLNTPYVKVNTVGYASDWPKVAIVTGEPVAASVLPEGGGAALVLDPKGFKAKGHDKASDEGVWEVDFSALTATGKYRVQVALKGAPAGGEWLQSAPFVIEPSPYRRALLAAQKMFYYHRPRTELSEPYTLWDSDDDDYTRSPASHTHGDVGWLLDHYPEKKQRWPLEKGWFDAGNYDMYIPSTGPSAHLLLWAYELTPTAFDDANGIPESGNGIPDILDEAVWGLDWIASLQTKTGAFRAREATMQLGTVPHGSATLDKTERWVSGIASASTAKATAVLAKAARIYKPFDPKRAERYGRAAQKGWAWLKANPQRVTFNAHGSGQPLWDDGPDYPKEAGSRGAAAFELWRSFRLKDALKDLQGRWMDEQLSADGLGGGWPNIGRLAVLGVLLDEGSPAEMRAQARERLFEYVKPLRQRVGEDGYRCALSPDEYYWGSPTVLLEKAALLALAARLDPQGHAWAREAARDQWHWILGRNPNAWSLVSRVGRGPTRIYHLEWGHKRLPPPGYIVDGPNHHNAAFLAPKAPAKALLWYAPKDLASGVKAGDPWHNDQRDLWEGGFVEKDKWDTGWWVVTEVDVYYNAALVLAGALIVP
jgi:endoglucanase